MLCTSVQWDRYSLFISLNQLIQRWELSSSGKWWGNSLQACWEIGESTLCWNSSCKFDAWFLSVCIISIEQSCNSYWRQTVASVYKSVAILSKPLLFLWLVGNGIELDTYEHITVGSRLTCQSRPSACANGFTMRFSIKPSRLDRNSYLISSNPAEVVFGNGKSQSL